MSLCLRASKCSARPVQALGFGFFRSSACLGGSPVISNLRSRAKPVPRATVFSAPSTDSPARTPRTVGWHSSSVRESVASQIRTSASSPQTRVPPSSAPSTSSGSSPAPLRQHHACSGSADGCTPAPAARTPGSLRSARDKPDRRTPAFPRRAIDRAAPPNGYVGRRRHRRVDDLRLAIYSHVRLHPEVPLFALLRLGHLRIALLLPVLGRSGCVQDGRVHDRARRDSHPLRLQVQVHLSQDLFPQLMFFQQVPELAHRGLVRHRLTA